MRLEQLFNHIRVADILDVAVISVLLYRGMLCFAGYDFALAGHPLPHPPTKPPEILNSLAG